MMEIFLSVVLMAACFAMLGAGLLFSRRMNCVQGSCGGIANSPNPDIECVTCSGDPKDCPEKNDC